MKISDILIESQQIDEAPVGMLKRAGLGIASKLGSNKAAGALDTGKIANGLKKAYDRYLGQTGQKPDSDSIIAFLQSNGLPTDAAEKTIQQAGVASGAAFAPAKDMKTTLGIGKKATGPMATPNPKAPAEPTGNIDTGVEPKSTTAQNRTEPKMGAEPVDYDKPAYQRKGIPEPKFMTPQQVLKSKLKGGKGLAKTTGGGFGAAVKAGKAKGLNMSLDNNGNPVMEVELKSSTVDKIILAAVQDSVKQGLGQQLSSVAGGNVSTAGGAAGGGSADSGSDQPGMVGKFAQGFKQGMQGTAGREKPGTADPEAKKTGSLNMSQILQMFPEVDPNKLKQAVNLVLSGQKLNQQQLGVLGQVMGELVKMDAQKTVKVMNILKRVSA